MATPTLHYHNLEDLEQSDPREESSSGEDGSGEDESTTYEILLLPE